MITQHQYIRYEVYIILKQRKQKVLYILSGFFFSNPPQTMASSHFILWIDVQHKLSVSLAAVAWQGVFLSGGGGQRRLIDPYI